MWFFYFLDISFEALTSQLLTFSTSFWVMDLDPLMACSWSYKRLVLSLGNACKMRTLLSASVLFLNFSLTLRWSFNFFTPPLKLATSYFKVSASFMLSIACCLELWSSSWRVLTSSSFDFCTWYFDKFSFKDLFLLLRFFQVP